MPDAQRMLGGLRNRHNRLLPPTSASKRGKSPRSPLLQGNSGRHEGSVVTESLQSRGDRRRFVSRLSSQPPGRRVTHASQGGPLPGFHP